MSRASMTTPCPAQPGRASGKRLSISSFDGFPDDTLDIDYTRAIQHEFRNAKPKRRPTLNRRHEKMAPVTIFEDVLEEDVGLMVDETSKRLEGKTLLGKPAQRIQASTIPMRKPYVPESKPQVTGRQLEPSTIPSHCITAGLETTKLHPLRNVGQPRRRPSIMPSDALQTAAQPKMHGAGKEMRRRTIYIPPDATTMMTIHPGADNTERLDDTFLFPSRDVYEVAQEDAAELPIFQKPVRRPRKSLAAAPRRMPLQHMDANQDGLSFDVAGANTGKENLPPCAQETDKKAVISGNNILASKRASLAGSRFYEPTAASQCRRSTLTRKPLPLPESKPVIPQKRVSTYFKASSPTSIKTRVGTSAQPASKLETATKRSMPTKPAAIDRLQTQQELRNVIENKRNEIRASKLAQYPTLAEDLSHPELYEDGWLEHQEIALAEVINQIFRDSEQNLCQSQYFSTTLRERMVQTYHQPEVTMLYKRIQASLVYGALSRPKEMPSINVHQDIGLRKRFLSLWLENYDEDVLRTAAEVVVGRQIPRQSSGSVGGVVQSECLLDPHANRRSLTAFLEMFFVSVGDVETADGCQGENGASIETARWRKTMLRSIMLVWLLDHAKTSGDILVCLFQKGASRKTSMSILNGLCSMLLPSVGDVSRALRHLDYETSHVQDPLDEVQYQTQNLAVDLRDGVLLAHLVEILLYDLSGRDTSNDEDATITIALPDATILQSALLAPSSLRSSSRVLSQHLKIPCIGRAQKLFNVQIALSALESHNIVGSNVVGGISAADVVDGHREKTLSMLWSLVASFGLDVLVDWRELAADIARNGGNAASDGNMTSWEGQEALLQTWASTHAASSRVSNLTSSFASGEVYTSIVNAFARFMVSHGNEEQMSESTGKRILETRLQSIGCSSAFVKQLTSGLGLVPSRETTVSNLAFLASRLLPLARNFHAALRIQTAFRQHRMRQAVARRMTLMRMAHACATVVEARNRIVHAAEVLQRAWRHVLAARIGRLNQDATSFQMLAKGWAVRKQLSSKGDTLPEFIMAGW